jgi:hypothetical protein
MEIPTPLFEPSLEIGLRHSSSGGFCDKAFEEFCRANPDLRIERNAQGALAGEGSVKGFVLQLAAIWRGLAL